MPIYEYACRACDHEWERVQKMTDDPVRKCPECGKEEARRLIGKPFFILKGPGWAADGYSGSD